MLPRRRGRIVKLPALAMVAIPVLASCVLASTLCFAADAIVPAERPASLVTIEVVPQLELLVAAMSQTSYAAEEFGSGGNDYWRVLQDYMAPFRDHEAVRLVESLIASGFTYDAPPTFALCLGPLPDLDLLAEYPADYLVNRAGPGLSRAKLEDLRLALKRLAADCDFGTFLAAHQADFELWAESTAKGYDGEAVVNWLETFFGEPATPATYRIILSPALFPRGGAFGPSIEGPTGVTVCEVLTSVDRAGAEGGPPEFQTGSQLASLTLHEWGHSFVNPALLAHSSDFDRLTPLYDRVSETMEDQAYGVPMVFFLEQVLRAAEVLATEDREGAAAMRERLRYEEDRGFYLTRLTMDALREYESSRDPYPTFESFVPVLASRYEAYLATQSGWSPGMIAFAVVALVAVFAVAALLYRRFLRREATPR